MAKIANNIMGAIPITCKNIKSRYPFYDSSQQLSLYFFFYHVDESTSEERNLLSFFQGFPTDQN